MQDANAGDYTLELVRARTEGNALLSPALRVVMLDSAGGLGAKSARHVRRRIRVWKLEVPAILAVPDKRAYRANKVQLQMSGYPTYQALTEIVVSSSHVYCGHEE